MPNVLEDLKRDLDRNRAALASSTLPTDVKEYLDGTVWPWLEGFLDEALDHDDRIERLEDAENEDVIGPETSSILATPIAIATEIISELAPMVPRDSALAQKIVAFSIASKAAFAKLEEISVYDDGDEIDPDDDGDDDDDDDAAGEV